MSKRRRFHHSLRFKLLLVGLTLLAIPWTGYRFIQQTETLLREHQEQLLLNQARALAVLMLRETGRLPQTNEAAIPTPRDIYLHDLPSAPNVDGYAEEWQALLADAVAYGQEQTVEGRIDQHLRLRVVAGQHQNELYLLIQVEDDQLVYPRPAEHQALRGDHLRLSLQPPNDGFRQYVISSTAPGWVNARFMATNKTPRATQGSDFRIRGEWQEWRKGYQVELRLPAEFVGGRLAVAVNDLDPEPGRANALMGTGDTRFESGLGHLLSPDPALRALLQTAARDGTQLWLLSGQGHVLARAGNLQAKRVQDEPVTTPWFLWELFRWIMRAPADSFLDRPGATHRLSGPPVEQALAGTAASHRRPTTDVNAVVLSAAYPIKLDGRLLGAILVEQTTQDILSLQNDALKRLYGISLLLICGTGVLLLGYASLLTRRIRRLRDNLEQAVSPEGRILGSIEPSDAKDEIGDLQRGFFSVLQRLAEYNRYLESMASRLAHELRTPMSIIRGSLDNLQQLDNTPEIQKYLQRAQDGGKRLELILRRMREASRLEQSLQQARLKPLDLCAFLNYALEGYRGIYPQVIFELELPDTPVRINAAADLLAQALDKLVANAVDFHERDTPIRLSLRHDNDIRIEVSNQGPRLPASIQPDRLFQSLVSYREHTGDESNLGLGLYIVRLIAEFHGGKADAANLSEGSGVRMRVHLPKPARSKQPPL